MFYVDISHILIFSCSIVLPGLLTNYINRAIMVTRKQSLNTTIVIVFFFLSILTLKAQTGEELFRTNCASCHTVGKGRLYAFGPEITFRAQSHNTFKMLFNQLYK